VHADPDNFANILTRYAPAPDATTLATGDAGARIACGVVTAAS
jgi:Cu-Zn family superoxide dismutase